VIYSHFTSSRNILSDLFHKYFQKGTRYKIAFGSLVLGVGLIVVPIPRETVSELPQTGEESFLEVTISADKKEVERDNPVLSERSIKYSVKVANTAECARYPLELFILYDVSGSMLSHQSDAYEAVSRLIAGLDPQTDRVGVITFGESVSLLHPLSSDFDQIAEKLQYVAYGGSTNLGIALDQAQNSFEKTSPDGTRAIIVVTDGRSNKPDGVHDHTFALQKARDALDQGIQISSIVYGDYADVDFVQSIVSTAEMVLVEPTGADILALVPALTGARDNDAANVRLEVDLSKYQHELSVQDITSGGIYGDGSVVWDVGTIMCKETVIHQFTAIPNEHAADLDEITVMATALSDDYPASSSGEVSTTIHAPIIDMSLTNNVDYALPADQLTYNLGIKNLGTGTAYDVVVTDSYDPTIFTLDKWSVAQASVIHDGLLLIDNDGSKYTLAGTGNPSGSYLVISLRGLVNENLPQGVYTLLHTFEVHGNGFDLEKVAETKIPNAPDLSVTVNSIQASPGRIGAQLDYVVSIENKGVRPAQAVSLSCSVTPVEGVRVETGDFFEYFPVLNVGEQQDLKLAVTPLMEGEITLQCTVSPNDPAADINPADNSFTLKSEVVDGASIKLGGSLDKTIYLPDEQLQYVGSVKNVGTDVAKSVTVSVEIPDNVKYRRDLSSLDGVSSDSMVHVELGDLVPEKEHEILLVFDIGQEAQEGVYPLRQNVSWTDAAGTVYVGRERNDALTVGSVETSAYSIPESVRFAKQEGFSLIAMLPQTGEPISVLKVVLGIGLFLPLPLLIIIDIGKHKKSIRIRPRRVTMLRQQKRKTIS